MEKSALVHVWKGGHGLLAILGLVHFDRKSSWVQFLPQPPHLDSGEGTVWWGRARISSWGKVVENTEPHKKKKKKREKTVSFIKGISRSLELGGLLSF